MRAILPLLMLFAIRLTPAIAFQSVAVAAPAMIGALKLDHAQAGLLLGAFMLPGIVVTVPAGMLARRIGDRAVLCGGLTLIALGALTVSRVNSFPALLAARVLGGAGGVSVLMLVIKMTTDRYAGPWLSTASAITITSWPAGLALGLLLLGPVPAALGWHATLGLAGVPALLAILLVPFAGRAPTAVSATGSSSVPAPRLAFVIGAVLSWSMINAVLAIIVGFLPDYLVSLGRSIDAAAAAASLAVWCPAVAIPFGGLLADRLIGRRAAVIAGLLATAGFLVIVATSGGAAIILIGVGLAFSAAPGPLTAQLGQATPPSARAVVFGWYSAGSYTAMTIAPWLAGWLRDATGEARAPLLFAAALSLTAVGPYALMNRLGAAQSSHASGLPSRAR